jgi:SHAQKYF class myb-like DNA-binding protein
MGKAPLETRSSRSPCQLHVANKNKKRIRWTAELHQRFEQAVAELGGANCATPKGILEKMQAPDVTIMHVKSHLQKYRLTLTAEGQTHRKMMSDDGGCDNQRNTSATLEAQGDEEEVDYGREDGGMEYSNIANSLAEAEVKKPQSSADDAARKKLVDTVVQQHTMQEELRHQIRVSDTCFDYTRWHCLVSACCCII